MLPELNIDAAKDPQTPPEALEALYWAAFSSQPSLHRVCVEIAKNPNISRQLLKSASLHTREVAQNPALAMLLLEDPNWCRININPVILRAITST